MLVVDAIGFNTEEQMAETFYEKLEKDARDHSQSCKVLAGIAFRNILANGSFPRNVEYALRFPSSPRNAGKQRFHLDPFKTDSRWFTEFSFPLLQQIGPRENGLDGGIPGNYFKSYLLLTLCMLT